MKTKLHPDVVSIAREAPKWARWLCSTPWTGDAVWTRRLGEERLWDFTSEGLIEEFAFGLANSFAIDLRAGDVHLQSASGEITIVRQDAWVKWRKDNKRRARTGE